jgi:hypothetical protein
MLHPLRRSPSLPANIIHVRRRRRWRQEEEEQERHPRGGLLNEQLAPSLTSTFHIALTVHLLLHRVEGFGMHSGAGIYNIDTGRVSASLRMAKPACCEPLGERCVGNDRWRCLFIVGLVAGYWLLEAAVPIHVRYRELVRIAGERSTQ